MIYHQEEQSPEQEADRRGYEEREELRREQDILYNYHTGLGKAEKQ